MRCYTFIIILVSISLMNLDLIAQGWESIPGAWQNELGSVLVIDSINSDHQIMGKYKSSTGVDGQVFPLLGWINEEKESGRISIAFSVRWDGYGSITSWTGYFDADEQGTFMKTLWHLVRPQSDLPWERIITNASIFRKNQE